MSDRRITNVPDGFSGFVTLLSVLGFFVSGTGNSGTDLREKLDLLCWQLTWGWLTFRRLDLPNAIKVTVKTNVCFDISAQFKQIFPRFRQLSTAVICIGHPIVVLPSPLPYHDHLRPFSLQVQVGTKSSPVSSFTSFNLLACPRLFAFRSRAVITAQLLREGRKPTGIIQTPCSPSGGRFIYFRLRDVFCNLLASRKFVSHQLVDIWKGRILTFNPEKNIKSDSWTNQLAHTVLNKCFVYKQFAAMSTNLTGSQCC